MRSRLKFAAAVSVGIFSSGSLPRSQAAVIYSQIAYGGGTSGATATAVPANPNLNYTTAGSPNANTTLTTSPITNEYFQTFNTPAINQTGDIAFSATSNGSAGAVTASTALQNINGLYVQKAGILSQLAHEGTYAPDRNGNPATGANSTGTFQTFNAGSLVSGLYVGTGGIVTDYERVKANKTSGGSDDSVTPTTMTTGLAGIISNKSGSLALLYRQNDTLSGSNINGLAAFTTNPIAVNPSGNVAAAIDSGSPSFTNASYVTDVGGTLQFVAQHGASTPTLNQGTSTTFNGSSALASSFAPVINGAGQIAFKDGLNGTGITTSNNVAIFSQGGGTFHMVAQGFQQAPSLPAGDAFNQIGMSNPSINNAGQIAFSTTLSNNSALGAGDIISTTGASGTANNGGLFAEYSPILAAGNLTLVARKGDQAAGTPTGTVYTGFNNPVINDTGRIFAEVSLSNASNASALTTGTTAAFYTFDKGGPISLIARTGTIAPGTSLIYTSFGLNNFAINGPGQVAFAAGLGTSIGGTTTNNALFAQDSSGTVQLLVVVGQSFTIAPGDVSTVTSISALSNSGGEDGKVLSWNDNGTVAVNLTFANGQQGVYAISVPEPTSAGILLLGSGMLLRRRNRKLAATH